MPSFKGKKDGAWSDASVVYGKSSGSWLYGKYALAKRNGVWERAWTDCRQHDATGGRDWSSSSSSSTVTCSTCDSCGTSTNVVTTVTYTKTGCPTYTRTSETGCSACGTWNQITAAGTYTTSDGVTATYVQFNDWLGGGPYLAVSTCGQGQCGCTSSDRQAYTIEQCSVTGVYRRSSPYCVRVSFF